MTEPPDYVAAQLRAMGLGPDVLGKPITVAPAASRCTSTNLDGQQCVLTPEHPGDHLRGRDRWSNDGEHTARPDEGPADPGDEPRPAV